MTFRFLTIFLLLFTFNLIVQGQPDTARLTLEEVVSLAKRQSTDAQAAVNQFRNNYWQYQTFKAKQLPQLNLSGTLPDLSRSISGVTQPDGTEEFRERSLANYSADLNLSQDLPFTGGEVFANSSLKRIDIFEPQSSTSYLSTPVSIGYRQPIFSFNSYKWEKKIQPLKYKEANRQYLESMVQMASKATGLYFDVYAARIDLRIAEKNKANKDTLYKIAKGRFEMGKIAENELLQMELSQLNAEQSFEQSELSYENSIFRLKSFIGIEDNTILRVEAPEEPEPFMVNEEKAKTQAMNNRSDVVQFERALLEAERDVTSAKKDNSFSADLFATYGLSERAPGLDDAYTNPKDQQDIRVGLELPLLDWGRRKAKSKMAEANRELVQTNIQQQRIDFKQEVILAVQEFNRQAKQLKIAKKANKIGERRYEIAKKRFKIGKVDITDLNLAATERDRAERDFIQSLRNFWNARYQLRRLTLYDFKADQPLDFNEDELIR